tara:strand:+ start:1321 stop:1437 length:117 start_codon:yes stop_codon:yes gene_type:complete
MDLEKIISMEEPTVPNNVNEDGMPIVDPEVLRKLEKEV